MSKYKLGDRVKILDGSNIRDYIGDWYDEEMKKFVGTTGVINAIVSPPNKGGCDGYHVKGNGYVWDERGLELDKSPSLSVGVDPETGQTPDEETPKEELWDQIRATMSAVTWVQVCVTITAGGNDIVILKKR